MHSKTSFFRIRSAEGSKGGLLLLLVTSAAWGAKVSKISAADSHDRPYVETTDHPFLEPQDLKAAVCLKCHSAKDEGKFVHTAVQMGCDNCHQAISSDARTVMTLSATGGTLCAKCHEVSKNPSLHEPYKAGQCMICHDPHASDYRAHLRADGNALMPQLSHAESARGASRGTNGNGVSVHSQIYDLTLWQSAPKITAEHPGSSIQSNSGEPPAVKTERAAGKTASATPCVSCHDPHAGKSKHLLRSAAAHRTPGGSHQWPSGFMGLAAVHPDALASQGAVARGLI